MELLGSKNTSLVKTDITTSILKYVTLTNSEIDYRTLYKRIWNPKLSPYDPDSGWGIRPHKTVFPLTGQNNEIVPGGSKGYLMDKTCSSDPRSGNSYSYTNIFTDSVGKSEVLCASVFCYISEDFNGTWALISCEGGSEGEVKDEYDLSQKGTWQKLTIRATGNHGILNVYLYFSKFGVEDFKSLDGYVIYAYPVVEIIKNSGKNELQSRIVATINSPDPVMNKMRRLLTEQIRSGASSEFGPDKSNNKFEIEKTANSSFSSFNIWNNVYNRGHKKLLADYREQADDPIRNWMSGIITEDTSYQSLSGKTLIDSSLINTLNDRVIRWYYGWKIYTQEYSVKQILIGGGFTFLNWYGFYFLKDKTASDWPHNPFLSILLYSGILGLLLYLFLLYKVFYYYIKYRKEYGIFFIFFLITFFFSFFSGGSPFDPPIMGFFTLLPFFIHSIHKKDNTKQELNTTNEKDTDHR